MARKSRKNMPVAVAEPTDNLTAKAVLSMDKEAKPYQVGIYARLSFESEANKERDTVDTQIAYIREFINGQDDMVEVCVYADISVTGTTFERPEFDRMIQDIRAGKINTVITRDLSRLGRNYVEAGNYIERVFPFLDVRYIAITDDFDTARPGTDLSVPLKNIVNEYYSKDLSKKVETGKHSIWAQGGFSEGTPPYGYYRATDGSRKLLIDEEVSDNVVRIFNMFLDGKGYAGIAKTLQNEGILSPPKYRFYKSGKIELAEKAREWHYSHVKEILQGEYYIGNIVHGKQRKALDTGRKNVKTDASTWQRIENVHEPIIDKDTFYKTRERMEHIKKKHLEASKPKADVPNKPDNILVYKTKCACCGGSVLIGRHHTYSEKFYYKCKNRRKLARLCENKYSYDYSEVMDSVFSVIRQHMSLCVEKTKFVQKMNSRKENVLQYDIYTKQIAKLQNDVRRITANKSGLYEDYREQLAAHEESNSISHQRKLMLDHIQKLPELKDCNIMEFSDDGYSGADFSRPNFVKMMDLVKAGKIQVIVTKDYSRLGRDYLEVGNYMECIFPVLQVRYISVNDNYDSANSFGSTGGMSVALKNLVNALYCKDASKKVRAAKAVLAKQGKYIAAFAPFGYQKSEDDKHMLVPDPVTAPVVQLIFELAIKGMKYTEIANYLNNNGYDSIFEYYQKIGVKRCYERDIGEHMWSASTVMEILYNEVYIGSVINNKTADNIDTGHQVVQRDKEDWIIVENCHEPLVSVEDFKLAHKMIARREVTKRKPNGKWRKSYIRCGICGKGLYKYGNKSSYRCHNGHVSRIRGEELEATLLDIARNMALAQLQEFELKTDGGNCPDNLEREIESLKKSKAHYAKLKFEIYDDYTKTNITRDQMAKKTAEVKQKIAEIESLITEKQETLDMQKDLFLDAKQEQLTKLSKLDEFDEEVIRYLIDYVLVYDNEHIEIRWNFDDFQAG